MNKKFSILYVLALIIFPTKAFAYLDPGTGSFILQAIIGFLAALSAGFLYYWTKVKNFFLKSNVPFVIIISISPEFAAPRL